VKEDPWCRKFGPLREDSCSPNSLPIVTYESEWPPPVLGCNVLACSNSVISKPFVLMAEKFQRRKVNSLHILLSVEQQSQQYTQELLHTFSRDSINDVSLEFLRTEVDEGLGEGFCKSGPEHDDELPRKALAKRASPNHAFWTCKLFENATIGAYTHSNVRIVYQDEVMGWRSCALWRG